MLAAYRFNILYVHIQWLERCTTTIVHMIINTKTTLKQHFLEQSKRMIPLTVKESHGDEHVC